MRAPARRVAFFTIGQSPRSDVVPEIAPLLGSHVMIDEFGALDNLDEAALRAMQPRRGAYRFATRLRDGTQIELDKEASEQRLADIMSRADSAGYDVLVPLCTGTAIAPMRTLVVEPQQVVDHLIAGLAGHCRRIGLVVPLAAQVDAFHLATPLGCGTRTVHASPYEQPPRAEAGFEAAGQALADCDLVVLHCMGYAEHMRRATAAASGRPVLLSNRIVAHALAQILA